ncbi:MAG: hypothetical protein HUU38_20320 [Anaerolineales bacterium]|nr:hypothetical protein [Anaerolineales bacterium]
MAVQVLGNQNLSGVKIMKTISSPNQKPNLFFTLAISLAVLLFGIVIKSAFADTNTPVSEQVAKAESEISSEAPAPVNEVSLIPSDQKTSLADEQPSSPSSTSDENQPVPQVKSQVANGIEFTISNYSRVAYHFYVDVCYDLPGSGILDINEATLLYGPLRTSSFEFREISLQVATEVGQTGRRCANLDFNQITTSETSKTFTLIIGSLSLVLPAEGEECKEYLARGEAALAKQGITIQCDQGTEFGLFNYGIVSKPDAMSQEQADELLYKTIFGIIEGPWTFNGTVEK